MSGFPRGGGGAVASVNGQTGVVVLDAGDVGAQEPMGTTVVAIADDANGSTDISSTNASRAFGSATANWVAGQYVSIRGAGAAGATYVGQISTVVGTTATMTAASPTAGATASNLTGFWGTDDTVTWQAAARAAVPGTTLVGPVGFCSLIRRKNAACGTTNASATVTCVTAAADDVGKWAVGAGIPLPAFVGAVTPGVSFTLVTRTGGAAVATATASVTLSLGGIYLSPGVSLMPAEQKNYDPQSNPVRNQWGPTFALIEAGNLNGSGFNSGNPMIGWDFGSGFGDAIIYSVNQLAPTSPTPTAFAPVMGCISRYIAGVHIGRPTFCNIYWGIDLQGGRHVIDHPLLGCLAQGITVDHALDFVHTRSLEQVPLWDICEGIAWGPTAGTFDEFVLTNLRVALIGRADSFWFGRMSIFGTNFGLLCDNSPDATQGALSPYGSVDNMDVDICTYGVYCVHTQAMAVRVTQLSASANNTGVGTQAVAVAVTGAADSSLVVKGWVRQLTWSVGPTAISQFLGSTLIVPATNPG